MILVGCTIMVPIWFLVRKLYINWGNWVRQCLLSDTSIAALLIIYLSSPENKISRIDMNLSCVYIEILQIDLVDLPEAWDSPDFNSFKKSLPSEPIPQHTKGASWTGYNPFGECFMRGKGKLQTIFYIFLIPSWALIRLDTGVLVVPWLLLLYLSQHHTSGSISSWRSFAWGTSTCGWFLAPDGGWGSILRDSHFSISFDIKFLSSSTLNWRKWLNPVSNRRHNQFPPVLLDSYHIYIFY